MPGLAYTLARGESAAEGPLGPICRGGRGPWRIPAAPASLLDLGGPEQEGGTFGPDLGPNGPLLRPCFGPSIARIPKEWTV